LPRPDGVGARILPGVSSQFVRHVFRHANALEAEHTPRFKGLSERANSIMAEAERRVLGNPRTPFRARFDWIAVDRLLFDSIHALRESNKLGSTTIDEGVTSLMAVRDQGTTVDKAEADKQAAAKSEAMTDAQREKQRKRAAIVKPAARIRMTY